MRSVFADRLRVQARLSWLNGASDPASGSGTPAAFWQHAHDFGMDMLASLADQDAAVGFWHRVLDSMRSSASIRACKRESSVEIVWRQ